MLFVSSECSFAPEVERAVVLPWLDGTDWVCDREDELDASAMGLRVLPRVWLGRLQVENAWRAALVWLLMREVGGMVGMGMVLALLDVDVPC